MKLIPQSMNHQTFVTIGVLLSIGFAGTNACAESGIRSFRLDQVQLLDGPCKDAQELTRRYLHALDTDRLLYNYRFNAKLVALGTPLGCWREPHNNGGAFLGHYLSACAMMYAAAGDQELKAKADNIVAELGKCQQALGGEYLSAIPKSRFDDLESGVFPGDTLYTVHKLLAGLLDMYTLCGNQQALEIMERMTSYIGKILDKLSGEKLQDRTWGIGGMTEVLCNLYSVTGNQKHLRMGEKFLAPAFLDPLMLEQDNLTLRHANTHIPIIVGAARYYELTGDRRYRTAARYFWQQVANCRSYATGGTSYSESWMEPNRLADMTHRSQEFCCTYSMLELTHHLFSWTADPSYADYYERAYFNHVLGNQNPQGMGLYWHYLPLVPGVSRKESHYCSCFTNNTPGMYGAFWCCYGTSAESFSKLADSIYFHDKDGIYVNLFVASKVSWPEKDLVLEQATQFPRQPKTTFIFEKTDGRPLGLNLHIPYWAGEGVQVRLNGEPVNVNTSTTSYLTLTRPWKPGDKVELKMPMKLHAHPMPDDPELVAIMYGPVVLAGLTDSDDYLLGDINNLESWITPSKDQDLVFRTVGQPTDITFIPLNKVIDQRYSVYFVVVKEGNPRHQRILARNEAQRRLEARIIDRVIPHDLTSESAHNLCGTGTDSDKFTHAGWPHGTSLAYKICIPDWTSESGYLRDKTWRQASGEDWWSWDLKVLPDAPIKLLCTYWGDDTRERNFEILVEDKIISTVSLGLGHETGEFFNIEYQVPAELTRGKDKATVKFRSCQGRTLAGPIFGCATIKVE